MQADLACAGVDEAAWRSCIEGQELPPAGCGSAVISDADPAQCCPIIQIPRPGLGCFGEAFVIDLHRQCCYSVAQDIDW